MKNVFRNNTEAIASNKPQLTHTQLLFVQKSKWIVQINSQNTLQ